MTPTDMVRYQRKIALNMTDLHGRTMVSPFQLPVYNRALARVFGIAVDFPGWHSRRVPDDVQ